MQRLLLPVLSSVVILGGCAISTHVPEDIKVLQAVYTEQMQASENAGNDSKRGSKDDQPTDIAFDRWDKRFHEAIQNGNGVRQQFAEEEERSSGGLYDYLHLSSSALARQAKKGTYPFIYQRTFIWGDVRVPLKVDLPRGRLDVKTPYDSGWDRFGVQYQLHLQY